MFKLKQIVKRSSLGGPLTRVYWHVIGRHRKPLSSDRYWERRYAEGGNSGLGSYGRLAEFKAKTINSFLQAHGLDSVIEFGCGDGNQLRLGEYSSYVGFDVSPSAVDLCKRAFADDLTKRFCLMTEYQGETADVVLSLDVVYHLVEDEVFVAYMRTLFAAARQYAIIYSSDKDHSPKQRVTYVRHRHVTRWIAENLPDWELREHHPNPYPFDERTGSGSFADFYIYRRRLLDEP
jgi:SAM-dependent methyltransferase